MKRWNGRGTVNTDYPVPPSALDYPAKRISKLDLIADTTKETVLSAVTQTRLPTLPLVDWSARNASHTRVDNPYTLGRICVTVV